MASSDVNFEIAVIEARLDIDERYADNPGARDAMHMCIDLVCADIYSRRVASREADD